MTALRPPLVGLLGANVGHSRLPRLFMGAWRKLGKEGLCVPLDLDSLGPPVEEDRDRSRGTASVLLEARRQGFSGVAVTMPCKEWAANACDSLDPAAAVIGSVNCVQFRRSSTGGPPRLHGKNLDGWGAVLALKEALPELAKPKVLFLGAGGVALGVGQALSELGAQLFVFDLNAAKAQETASRLSKAGYDARACDTPEAVLGEVDGVANCTPVGMHGGPPGSPLDEALLRRSSVRWVFDAVCYPTWTPLLLSARRLGRVPVAGMRMNDFIQREMFIELTGEDRNSLPADLFPSGMSPPLE